ncbi:Na+/H+ antiporter subunit D [Thermomicrobium sp. 4228-Ro]|uniref:Na+/H+ antiporter subunit D n=1 Tax=Thermomicrobium sp. 4228-Ro TaxID=2993937 RepID=UPI00224889D4|nr:Na+/H+ antiporter subunit D [Thermomicrobium sp. 4228-Ro]MCX2728355.1 Na+/H+ antiporter subunit D [Thermomicrobium sp. 4228-Ro]
MGLTLVLPLLIPLVTTLVLFAVRQRRRVISHGIAIIGATLTLLAAAVLLADVWTHGIRVIAIGRWPPPYGIVLVADLFSSALLVVSQLVSWATVVYATAWMDPDRERAGFYPLVFVLLVGVNGAFLTGDLFNLYVWFEVMLMASFVLLVLGVERGEVEGGIKYVSLNLLASTFFLSAAGILYGIAGTLNLADLSVVLPRLDPGIVTVIAMLFAVAFGIKAAVFPLFFWLPASYHTPPVPVSALFAGLLTKVGVYALIRVFTLLFVHDPGWTHRILLVCAASTMVTGVLGALAQQEVRRILSFHIVSQIGYMIFGLALLTPLGLSSSVYYLIHHIVVKTNLFLIGGLVERTGGSSRLANLGGLDRIHPWLGLIFLIPALSLAGIPPLSGFFAKLLVIRAGFAAGTYCAVAVAIVVSLLTLLSMLKIWNEAFWKEEGHAPSSSLQAKHSLRLVLPSVLLALVTILIGIAAEPVLTLSTEAAEQLLDNQAYRDAVLGARSAQVAYTFPGGGHA